MDDRPIGVFDSGVGGLTVVAEMVKLLPNESIIYFGDTGRAPYGGLTIDTLNQYAKEIVSFLTGQNVKALVVACNTMSTNCMDTLEQMSPVPVVGMLKPGVEAVLESGKRSVCLLATKATVESGAHTRLLAQENPSIQVYAKACIDFVSLVEAGLSNSPKAEEAAKEALAEFAGVDIEAVLLGCTHYPLMEQAIQKAAGKEAVLINPAQKAAERIQHLLSASGLLRGGDGSCTPTYRFTASGATDKMAMFLSQIFGPGHEVEHICL